MKTALILVLLAGTLLTDADGDGSLSATRARIRALREEVSLLGDILERTERVADMALREEGDGEGDSSEDNPLSPEVFGQFFYGLMGLLEKLVKGESFRSRLASLAEMLESLPKNYSKVTHTSDQQGNATINTTTTIEKSQSDGQSYSFGHVQTSVNSPNQKSFFSVIQESFQSQSGSADGDNANSDDNAPKATEKPAEGEAKTVRRLRLLDLLKKLRETRAKLDS